MKHDRQALHDLVDQAPEEALPRLLAEWTYTLFPPEPSGASGMITFFPNESGALDTEASRVAEFEQRPGLTVEADLEQLSNRVEQQVARAIERLGIHPESLGTQTGQSAAGTTEGFLELRCDWQAGPRRHRLSTFYVEQQEVITFERIQLTESGSVLSYQVQVVTPTGEAEGALQIPFPPGQFQTTPTE